jgi:hypothetical protein
MSHSQPQRSAAIIDNYRALNAAFYTDEPWRYFERRMLHLAEVAQDPAAAMSDKSFTVGALTVEMSGAGNIEPDYPTPAQSFIAIESEVLLHHAAETALRLIYAHDGGDPCPLMRISELRSFSTFKDWVARLTTSNAELEAVVRSVFPGSPHGVALENLCQWVAMLARHFLDSAPYNAAKHGMTLAGGAEQRTIEIDGVELSNAKGASVSWLELWPRDDPARRWARASRLLSVEAFLALIHAITLLIQAVWGQGRHVRFPDVYPDVDELEMPSPIETFQRLGVDWYVLSRWFEPLVADGETRNIHMQMPVQEALRVFAGKSGVMTRTRRIPSEES